MGHERKTTVAAQLAKHAAVFVAKESNRQSLVTITRADISPDLKRATIFYTVLPQDAEDTVHKFLERQRTDFRTYIKKHMKIKTLPWIGFALDVGEKSRQRLDELSE